MSALRADLTAIDERLTAIAARLRDVGVLYSHPVYQYLDRRYSLDGRALHWEPDAQPDAAQWDALERELSRHAASVMLWEAAPLPAVREQLSQMNIEVVVFPTLANAAPEVDYAQVMNASVSALAAATERRAAERAAP